MTRKFQPGDVAMIHGPDRVEVPAIWQGNQWATSDSRYFNDYLVKARPLVVIDPEDREQVRVTLAKIWMALEEAAESDKKKPQWSVSAMQAALRSLIADPKPDEPQGLGAVVEDAGGNCWIRHGDGPAAWMLAGASPSNRDTYQYADIAAVRVLSEGVTP